MPDSLRALLAPRSIAIVGASADLAKVNGRPIRNLLRDGYAGRIYPVNPNYREVAGLPCYPDVASIPDVPELGVVAVAAERVLQAIDALGEKGVKVAIVWTSGFAETGERGRSMEAQLLQRARHYGMRLCGPNTLGLTNAFERMPLTFSQYADTPLSAGPVAFVSQSGAFGTAVATAARDRGIGLGYFVSTGNQVDLTVASVIDEILDDERISVVVAYLEGLGDGLEFLAAADKARRLRKPLVVVKVGREAAGRRAAVSHTGSLAGDDAVFDSVIRQFGVLRAHDETHALDLAAALVACGPAAGPGVGLITISGGAGAMMADFAEEHGLEVPVLGAPTQERLSRVLRGFASLGNPVDVTGQVVEDVGILGQSLEIVLQDPQVAVCVIWVQLLHGQADRLVDLLVQAKKTANKPFVLCWLNPHAAAVRRLREQGVCVTDTTAGAIRAASGLVAFGDSMRRAPAEPVALLRRARPAGAEAAVENVPSIEAADLLARCGLPLAPSRLATSARQAAEHAEALGFPVALKIESADLPHKTEVDGIRLNIRTAGEAREAYDAVVASALAHRPEARIAGVLVQSMASPETELVLGLRRDPVFGPVVMVGLGGILIEVLKDVVFAVPPLDAAGARDMLRRLRAQNVLRGVRGKTPVPIGPLAEAICALSRLAQNRPEIAELDLNPVFAGSRGVVAVDWLMVRDGNHDQE